MFHPLTLPWPVGHGGAALPGAGRTPRRPSSSSSCPTPSRTLVKLCVYTWGRIRSYPHNTTATSDYRVCNSFPAVAMSLAHKVDVTRTLGGVRGWPASFSMKIHLASVGPSTYSSLASRQMSSDRQRRLQILAPDQQQPLLLFCENLCVVQNQVKFRPSLRVSVGF
jgi:hypothetical protein